MIPAASILEIKALLLEQGITSSLALGGIQIKTRLFHTNKIVKTINLLKEHNYIAIDFANEVLQNNPDGSSGTRNITSGREMNIRNRRHVSLYLPHSRMINPNESISAIHVSSHSERSPSHSLWVIASTSMTSPSQPKVEFTENIKKSINETQKNIIEGTLGFMLDNITELKPNEAIKALKAIVSENVAANEIEQFKKQDILGCIKQAREILDHPYPQNRSTHYPYFATPSDTTMVVYKDTHGKAAFEKKGLLSLTARNDERTSITKEAVIDYIQQLVNEEIAKQHQKLEKSVKHIQFWYKRTRDENKALAMAENKENSKLAQHIQSRRR